MDPLSIPKGISINSILNLIQQKEQLQIQHRLFVPIGGALQQAIVSWSKINGQNLVKEGLQANWNCMGPPMTQPPKEMVFLKSREELQAFNQILEEDFHQKIIIESDVTELYNPVFLVLMSSGYCRCIISCKQQGWAITLDLQQAYSHVTVSKQLQKYLAFSHQGKTYTYLTMPFGISTAPRFFTKIMRLVLTVIRQKGILTSSYLDDGIAWFQSQEKTIEGTIYIINLFQELELTINFRKSFLVPTQTPDYLGIH
ncbi:MAG: hypothetical protein EZS28_021443 [Streblomastix strix]|uniref:Reverse transcriptase domain-containing protein n=1 Tax=Streblomastix strix TaxID=222440 RepID=A0A5J4VL13_9EUKA|nr:MAG: hypothetical protein EZS28_021443 [Streblomastix strix]